MARVMINNLSISQKFTSLGLILYILAASSIAAYMYQDITRTNTLAAFEKLKSFEQLASQQFEILEERYSSEIESLASNRQIIGIAEKFGAVLKRMPHEVGEPTQYLRKNYITENPNPAADRDALVVPVSSEKNAYDLLHAKEHGWFRDFVNQRSSYMDLMFVATDGTVVYSVKKTDLFGDNLNTTSAANGLLKSAFVRAGNSSKGDEPAYSGYAPSVSVSNEMSAFLVAPIWDDWDEITGYLVFELSQQPLLAIFDQRSILGAGFHSFAVNSDMEVIFATPEGDEGSEMVHEHEVGGEHIEDFNMDLAQAIIETGRESHRSENTLEYSNDQEMLEVQGSINLFGRPYVSVWHLPVDALLAPTNALLNRISMLILATSVVFALAIFLASRKITLRLKQFQGTMNEISSNRDLSIRMENQANDEVGKSVESMNSLLDEVEDFVRNVKVGAGVLANVSDDMREASKKLSVQAEVQAASIEELSASLEETESQAQLAMDATAEASNSFEVAREAAGEGGRIADKVLVANESISKSSQDISNIIQVIENIAFQTNLLALNASVEAARAGAHGRGFAIVAQEVGSLAQKSASAAAESTNLINSTLGKIAAGCETSKEMRQAFEQIYQKVSSAAENVEEVSGYSREQVASVRQASRSSMELANKSYDTTERGNEAYTVSEQLRLQSSKLNSLTETFTVSRQTSVQAREPKKLPGVAQVIHMHSAAE